MSPGRTGIDRRTGALPWHAAAWSVVDIETTGLNFDDDDIISIGISPVNGGVIHSERNFYTLLRPTAPVTSTSSTIHSLTLSQLNSAPTPREAAAAAAARLAGTLVVAHAAWIEKAFLGRLGWETGQNLPLPVVDTAALCRAVALDDSPNGHEPPLEALARRLNLPVYTPHHALGDAMTTAVVFLALVSRLEQRSGSRTPTVRDLVALSRRYRA